MYTFYETNILLLYSIMLSILKSFTFFFVSYDCIIYNSNRYYASIIYNITLHSLSIFKIKLKRNKIKTKFTAHNSDIIFLLRFFL